MGLLQHSVPYNRLVIILTLIVLITHILLPLSSEAQLVNTPGSNNTTEIFQPNSQPFGLSYADWTARW